MAQTQFHKGELQFLQSLPLYESEKPYMVHFDTSALPEGAQQHNVALALLPVPFVEIKSMPDRFILDANGFQVQNFSTALSPDDFKSSEAISTMYYPEIESLLRMVLGHSLDRVIFLSHNVLHQLRRFNFSSSLSIATLKLPIFAVSVRSASFPELVPSEIKAYLPVPEAHCGRHRSKY